MEKRILYVRNYGGGIDLPWQTVFQTTDKAAVSEYCARAGIHYEWRDGDRLKTWQICQAVAEHPVSGDMVWFNQAHLFHISNHKAEIRAHLETAFKEEDLPRNAYYGDGTPIESWALENIRLAYEQEAVAFGWRSMDVLIADNMLVAHGRKPYLGNREVLVGMSDPYETHQ